VRLLWCRLRGHRWVYAVGGAPFVYPERGLVIPWEPAPPGEFGTGTGCTRCGRYLPIPMQ
jgi:hypothetical protein